MMPGAGLAPLAIMDEPGSMPASTTPQGLYFKEERKPSVAILEDQAERVSAKEATVVYAIEALEHIRAKIEDTEVEDGEINLQAWLSNLENLKTDNKAFEYLVGTAGDTGMGKSSLLNALVGNGEDLAPTSQNGACTAAICCFHHRANPEGSQKYAAKIRFKTKDDVDQELSAFFVEYKERFSSVEDDGDTELQAERGRLQEQLSIIQAWSQLDQSRLLDLGLHDQIQEISRQCVNGGNFFNYQNPEKPQGKYITGAGAREFLKNIRPYVGNTNRRVGSGPLLWPLVERVHIYLDAPILRNGIVLVDLPGEMDAVESRSRVAKQYYNKLDRLMVVTPCDRACDNRTAAELMRDDQILDFEADGMINDDGLCVVVTKTDLMNWTAFVGEGCEWDENDICPGFPEMKARYHQMTEKLDAMNDDIATLEEEDPSSDKLHTLRGHRDQVALMCERLNSRCLRACIEARNAFIVSELQKGFKQRRKSLSRGPDQGAAEDLSVFPVSSTAHRDGLKRRPMPGFPSVECAGIRALENWITRGSLPKRERHADGILSRCQSLFDAIEGWTMDGLVVKGYLPKAELPGIKAEVERLQLDLKDHVKKLATNLLEHIRKHEASKSSKDSARDYTNQQGFVNHVEKYDRSPLGPLHWSTYAALIRRNGGSFKSSGTKKTHCWQGQTYSYYWRPHQSDWVQAYNHKLPEYMKRFHGTTGDKMAIHNANVLESRNFPEEYKEAFRRYAYKIETAFNMYLFRIARSVDEFRDETKEIRRKTRAYLNEPLLEAYREARQHSGKGMKAKQIKTMLQHADRIKATVFHTVSKKISLETKEERKKLAKSVIKHNDELTKTVSKIELQIAELLCCAVRNAQKKSPSSATDPMIKDLKDSVQLDLDQWKEKWHTLRAGMPKIKFEPLDLNEKKHVRNPNCKKRSKVEAECSDEGMPLAKVAKSGAQKPKVQGGDGPPTAGSAAAALPLTTQTQP